MKTLFLPAFFFLILLIFSCKKNQDRLVSQDTIVKIDSLIVSGFDNVFISASFLNSNPLTITERGICWGKSQNPTILDSCLKIPTGQPFSITLNSIGRKTLFYFRAYLKIGNSIIYSDSKSIKTGALETVWDKEYNNGKNRDFVQVIETTDQSFLALVRTYGNSIDWTEIVKYDTSGNIIWDYEYNQNEWKEPNYLMQVNNGYVFVTTNWTDNGRGIFVTRLNLDGSKLWEKSFNRKYIQEFIRITSLSNDTLMLTTKAFDGINNNGIRTNCSINDFKIDLNGNLLYEDSVSNDNRFNQGSYAFKTLNIPNSGFLVANNYSPPNSSMILYDILVQKFDKSNRLSWEKTYGGNNDELPVAISTSSNGNYNILGSTYSYGTTGESNWLFQIDSSNGNKVWEFVYGNLKYGYSGYSSPLGLYKNNIGQFYITGIVTDYYYTNTSAYILKTSDSGKFLWDYTYSNASGINYSRGNNIIANAKNETYVFGSRIEQLSNNSNILFVTKFKEL